MSRRKLLLHKAVSNASQNQDSILYRYTCIQKHEFHYVMFKIYLNSTLAPKYIYFFQNWKQNLHVNFSRT